MTFDHSCNCKTEERTPGYLSSSTSHDRDILQGLNMLRSEKMLTDVTLWATDYDETSTTSGQTTEDGNISNDFPAVVPFFAHKAVLAASSEYFRAMFNASGMCSSPPLTSFLRGTFDV